MGGNALSKPGVRLNKSDYLSLRDEVLNTLAPLVCDAEITSAYGSKESFGDMDIVIRATPEQWQYITRNPIVALREVERFKNSNILSFGIDHPRGMFQIDLINAGFDVHDYQNHLHYLDYNDLGNLFGRIFHKLGFKYGQTGLLYVVRPTNDHVIGEIKVCNLWEALVHAEFNSELYAEFDTLEDIFNFVLSSPYFHPDIYLFDNLNAKSRVRDKKRATYNAFLQWLRDNNIQRAPIDYDVLKKSFTQKMFDLYPEFKQKYDKLMSEYTETQKNKEKFNAEMIWDIKPSLRGKELGMFIKNFRYKNNISELSKDVICQRLQQELKDM